MNSAVEADEFAAAMSRCTPFEQRPLLAVAVSGGADSMALALLADEWARARGGRIAALTVDHGLRAESRAEAGTVARWMRRRGIAHRTLHWTGAKPKTGIQAVARAARYRLLSEWCRSEGALHLLLGHNRDDQVETVLLRLAAGSGPFGLAAMPMVQETEAVRVVRPLLGVPRKRLEATLTARNQVWLDDPSNRDDRFARVRVRQALVESGQGEPESIAAGAAELARFRAAEERRIASLLARSVALFPEGYALVDTKAFAAAAPETGWRALAAVLATIGGLDYAPRGDAVRGLLADFAAGRCRRTLARCRIIGGDGETVIVREMRGMETLPARRATAWDNRFSVSFAERPPSSAKIGALGNDGWAEVVVHAPALRATAVPYLARLALPALRDRQGVAEIPGLNYRRGATRRKKTAFGARFRPARPLAGAAFAAGGPA